MAISLRKPLEIKKLRVSNQIVAQTLQHLKTYIREGMTLNEINQMGEEFIYSLDAKPAFKGLYGFPSGVCTSLNEVVIHGVPNDTKVKEGDILGLDIGVEKDGWFGDGAITIPIGKISDEDQKLIDCSYDTLMFAIDTIKTGMRFKELSFAIENYILDKGYVPLQGFCGHGIGRKPHEEPEIPNYLEGPNPKQGPKIKNGMIFCIEPMICQKSGIAIVDEEDKWSVRSEDGLNTSHYEHTVAIINNKAEILSVI